MLRRFHIVMVYALVALFISMSTTGAVVASISKPTPAPHVQGDRIDHSRMDHSKMDHSKSGDARHDHRQALADVEGTRDCLAFCFEGVSGQYLSADAPAFFNPEFVAFTPASFAPPALGTQLQLTTFSGSARGPPGPHTMHPVSGLRGILLLNARLRN